MLTTTTTPTEKQVAFLTSLLTGRVLPEGWDADRMIARLADGDVTKAQASAAIDRLLTFPTRPGARRTTGNPLPDVPAGYYAVDSRTGNNDLDFWVVWRAPEGATSVERVIGGRPDQAIRGQERREALEAIVAAGFDAAREVYATEIGRCGRCNRHLTADVSRERGLGPECATKV